MSMLGPYHRLGSPGGPGCRVRTLPAEGRSADGALSLATLLDAGETASELELLRTVAQGLGVRWGQDDMGWWAAVPAAPESGFAAAAEEASVAEQPHALYREDDNGARFLIAPFPSRAAAEQRAAELAHGGHKQHYFVEALPKAQG